MSFSETSIRRLMEIKEKQLEDAIFRTAYIRQSRDLLQDILKELKGRKKDGKSNNKLPMRSEDNRSIRSPRKSKPQRT